MQNIEQKKMLVGFEKLLERDGRVFFDETFKKMNSLLKQHKEEIMLGMHEYVDIKLFTSNFLKKME